MFHKDETDRGATIVKNRLSRAEILLRRVAGKFFEFLDEVGLVVEACVITELGEGSGGVVISNNILESDDRRKFLGRCTDNPAETLLQRALTYI